MREELVFVNGPSWIVSFSVLCVGYLCNVYKKLVKNIKLM